MDFFEGYNYRINIVGADSSIIVDSNTGLIRGCVADVNENIMVDTFTNTFQGTLVGSVVDKNLNVIVDAIENFVNANSINSDHVQSNTIKANTIQGNITNSFGDIIFDHFHNVIKNIDVLETNSITANKISGTLIGNLSNFDNDLVFDCFHNVIKNLDLLKADTIVVNELTSNTITAETISGNLINNIHDESGDLLLDLSTGTFYGKIYNDRLESLESSIVVQNNCDIEEDNSVGLTTFNFKTSNNHTCGINLCRGFGTIEDPEPVVPGSNLSSILFSAIVGNDIQHTEGVGYIGARVANDSNISNEGFAGEFVITVKGYNDDQIEGLVVDARGHTKTVLKDFSIVGNTNNTPISNEIDSWMEVIVNGGKRFIPLYR